jgi:hypothetical protein
VPELLCPLISRTPTIWKGIFLIIGDGLADERDLRRAVDIRLRDEAAVGQLPLANLLELRRDALNRRRPVLLAADHLLHLAQDRRSAGDDRDLAHDRLGIHVGEALPAAQARARTADGHGARQDNEQVRAETRNLLLDQRLGAFADRHHRDDGADADDDAQHGEKRAQLVAPERAERDAKSHE